MGQRTSLPWLFRHGATLGYVGLALVFFVPGARPPASKLSCRLGLLAPLQGLILLGLSAGEDPISRLFSHSTLERFGEASFAQYVLQFLLFRAWGVDDDLLFVPVMLGLSAVAATRIEQPSRKALINQLRSQSSSPSPPLRLAAT